MTPTFARSVCLYAETVDEVRGDVPIGRLFTDLEDFPELERDADLCWILGWLSGVAESKGLLPEQLITLAKEVANGTHPDSRHHRRA